jgi:hypothetical protein
MTDETVDTETTLTTPEAKTTDPADFRSALPQELATHKSLSDIKDIEGLAKSYVHAQELVGKSRLPMPSPEAPPAEWDKFYASIGRPSGSAENGFGYSFDGVEIPEGVVKDENMENYFRAKMHERGLTQSQAQGLYKDQVEFVAMLDKQNKENITKRDAEWDKETRQMFGLAHDEMIAKGKAIIQEFGDQAVLDIINQSRIGNNPAFINFMSKLGAKFLESGSPGNNDRGGVLVMTPSQAKTEINQLRSNADFMKQYLNKGTGHEEAVQRMESLHNFAYPEEQTG